MPPSSTFGAESLEDIVEGLSVSDAEFVLDAAEQLKARLNLPRFEHSISVCRMARSMARIYGIDVVEATFAGLLHDWDKCFKGAELLEHARSLGIVLTAEDEKAEETLHAITAAKSLASIFPNLSESVLQAISKHTTAAVEMSELDMLIFCADMLEPKREYGGLNPLRKMIGSVPLEELFSNCYRKTVKHLVERRRFIHPMAASVWNAWVAQERDRQG
ncbi:MAG: bis(5'-nucleosyl)-tetraphosphatase (symmetrical) YqeK [bacterium]|nr:bis(5'-nucleosyl)-tetraphosphatase (symmetrical) YqeK [bacterium]